MTPFAPLFIPAELQEAVSGRSWLMAMLEAERALAAAGADAGVVPAADASLIAAACAAEGYDWEQLLQEGREVGGPAEPLVRALVERVGEETARWVHLGATSQDIMDTAAMLVTRRALGLVVDHLSRVEDACAALADAHRDSPMAGRTLLQQAVPTTFGLKAAGWLVAVLDVRSRLAELRDEGLAAQLGGAVGTRASLGEHGPEVARLFARELDLAEAPLPWHTNRVRTAELGAALGIAAGVLAKIALDVLLLAQTEVAEVREGGRGGGSSAMPQKRNAVRAMSTRASAALARANASVLTDALVQEHERAGGAWQAEWDALSLALAATGGAAASLAESLERLEVDAARMRSNLDLTGGQVMAERVALVLTERLGRTAARALVRSASLQATETGRSLADELGDRDTGLTAEEIQTTLEPTTYLGSAAALVDRALALHEEARGGST
jgi:3-carboxy-cis,cis-muconate cycloisomerase